MSRVPAAPLAGRILAAFERQLMPRRCVFCGVDTVASEGFVCTGCNRELPRIDAACRTCGRPLATSSSVPCAACQAEPVPFACLVAPLHYTFPVDAAIKAMKYQRKLFYLPAFADILRGAIDRLPGDIEAVLPVPLHRWRKLSRGFNQAQELARPVAQQMQVPLLQNIVRRSHTPHQSGLSAAERKRNLHAAFAARGVVAARHVLIIDDVVTTGATCAQLARLLLAHGADRISVLAVARA